MVGSDNAPDQMVNVLKLRIDALRMLLPNPLAGDSPEDVTVALEVAEADLESRLQQGTQL